MRFFATRNLPTAVLWAAVCDPRQQIGVVGELRGVFESKSGGAFTVAGRDQCRDFDDLALTS